MFYSLQERMTEQQERQTSRTKEYGAFVAQLQRRRREGSWNEEKQGEVQQIHNNIPLIP